MRRVDVHFHEHRNYVNLAKVNQQTVGSVSNTSRNDILTVEF